MGASRYAEISKKRSQFIFDQVARWSAKDLEEITAKAQSLPVSMKSQGLLVSMANLETVKSGAAGIIARLLFEWLTTGIPYQKVSAPTPIELLNKLHKMDRLSYLSLQRESIQFMEQLKLISKAFHASKGAVNEG